MQKRENGRTVFGSRSKQKFAVRKNALLLLAAASAGLFNHAAKAASITWGSPTGIGSAATMGPDSDVMSLGTGNYAFDWNNVATTVNGVTFAGTTSGTSVGGGAVVMTNFSGNYNGFGNPNNVPGTLSAAYYNATAGGEYTNSGTTVTITLNNLISGHFYAVQTWVDDGRNSTTAARNETVTSAGGNSVTLQYGNMVGGVGQYAVGDFLAGGTSQAFTMTSASSTQINALQLRDITACWTGQSGATWDDNSINFTNNQSFATAKTILNGVFFGDTDGFNSAIANNNITIQTGGVQTGTVTFVNRNLAYTFNSAADNLGITGTTAVVLNGTGTVNFAGHNSYSGNTTINAGVLQLAQTQAQNSNTHVIVNSGGTFAVNAGGANEFTTATSGAGSIGSILSNTTGYVFNAGSSFGIDTTNGGNLVYAGNIAGLQGINKLGSGDLTLSGSNSYSGPTTITAGTLTAGSSNAFGNNSALILLNTNTANSGFNLSLNGFNNTVGSISGGGNNGGFIDLGFATLTVAGSTSPAAYAGYVTNGAIVKTGTGTLTLSGPASDYSGGTTLSAGTLAVATSSTATGSQGPIGSGTLTLGGGTFTNTTTVLIANPIAVAGSTTTTVVGTGGNFTLTGAITGSGTIQTNTGSAASVFFNGDLSGFTGTYNFVNVSNGNNVNFGYGGNAPGTTSPGNFDGSHAHFVLTGLTTTSFRSLGFFTGGSAGDTFQMGDLSGNGGLISAHQPSNGPAAVGTLQIGALNTSPGAFAGVIANDTFSGDTTAVTKVGSGTLDLAGANSYTGGTNIYGGTLKVDIAQGSTTGPLGGGSGSLPSGTITFGGGALQYSSVNNTDYSSKFATTAQPIQIDTNGRTVTFVTPLMSATSGSLQLNDSNATAGSLTLPVANTYTGATTITAGTLILDHSGANTGALNSSTGGVSVGSGAKLLVKGSTSITGSLSLAGGPAAILDLRDGAISTLAIGGGLSVGGSTINLDLGSSSGTSDALNVTGSVSETGATTINLNLLSSLASGNTTYTLISSTGGLSASNFTIGSKPAGFNTFGLSTPTPNALLLNISANATPSIAYWTGKASSTGSPTDPNNNWGYGSALAAQKSNWSTTVNGLSDPLQVPGAATDVFFTAANATSTAGALTTQLDSTYSIKGLTFDTSPTTPAISAVTLNTNGNPLTIGADGLTIASTNTSNTTISGTGSVLVGISNNWANNSGTKSLTITAPIAGTAVGATQVLTLNGTGAGGITLSGSVGDGAGLNGQLALVLNQVGTTQLNGNNTFTGGVTINRGIVQLGNAGALNSSTPNAVAFGAGSTGDLQLKGNSVAVAGLSTNATVGTPTVENSAAANATLTINSNSGTNTYGGVLQNGAGGGTLSLTKTGTGTQVLSGANSFTGPTLISAGVLNYQNATAFSTNSAITVAAGGTAQVQGGITSGTVPINLAGTGASGATGALESVAGINTIAAPVTLAANVTIAADAGTLKVTGNVTGAGFGPTFAGSGITVLSGANTYTGATVVTAGTVQAGAASVAGVSGALGNNSDVTITAGTLDLNNFNTQIGSLTGGGGLGAVTLQGATLTVAGSTAPSDYTGTISGTGSVVVAMSSTGGLVLSNGNSNYSGGTNLKSGTLVVGTSSTGSPGLVTAGPLGVGAVSLGGGNFSNSNTVTIDNAITVTAATTTNVVATGGNFTLTGPITGSGTIQTNTAAAASLFINGDLSGFTGTFNYNNVLEGNNLTFGFGGLTPAGNFNASNAHFVVNGSTANGSRGLGFFTGGTAGDTFQMGDLSGNGGVIGATKPDGAAGVGTLQIGALNTSPGPFFGYITDDFHSASEFDGETTAVVKVGTGTLNLSGVNDYTGGTTVKGGTLELGPAGKLVTGGNVTIDATSTPATMLIDARSATGIQPVTFGNVNLIAGGKLTVASVANPGSAANHPNRIVLIASSLNNAGKIDLGGNDLLVHNADAPTAAATLTAITGQLHTGFGGAGTYWNGSSGIVSPTGAGADSSFTTTLGVASGLTGTYSGQSVVATDVLVKFTYYGDTDLNGIVNGNDYSQIDFAFTHPGTMTGWQNGDFNYDGKIDGSDYSLIDNAFNRQGASLAGSPASMVATNTSEIASGGAVPEPGTLSLLGIGAVGLMSRRRRKMK